MLLVDEVDNREFVCNLLRAMYDELSAPKKTWIIMKVLDETN